MNTEKNNKEESGFVKSAADWSKVSKKKFKNHTHFYWLAGGMLAVLFVFLLSSKSSPAIQENSQSLNTNDYHRSLDENLNRLKNMTTEKPIIKVPTDEMQLANSHQSKEVLARQNAPTSMYSDSSRILVSSPATNSQSSDLHSEFGNTPTVTPTVEAQKMAHPDLTIASGEFLQAVLETAINSDLPGMVRAVTSSPVYAYTGERVLIPSGSRLIGQYSSAVIQGQNRVMVIWNRIVLPNGIAIQLNSPGTDSLGIAGQGADSLNTHFFARFGESALLSLIGAGAASTGVANQDQYNSSAQYRTAIAQSFQQSAQQSLQGTVAIKPTLHVFQGANINVFVAQDLSFYQVLKDTLTENPLSSLSVKSGA